MGGWTLWKLTAIATVLVATTAVVTGLVVAHWSGRETERAAAVAPSPPPPRSGGCWARREARSTASTRRRSRTSGTATPTLSAWALADTAARRGRHRER